MNVSEMARALGITRPMVRKYQRRGMPMGSEKLARSWLRRNTLGRFAEKDTARGGTKGGTLPARGARGSTAKSARAGRLEGLTQAELTKRLTAARIRLTERDTAIKRLREKQADVDARIREGHLVEAQLVRRVGFERARILRDKLLALPAEWALRLAATTDPALVADITRRRLKEALIEYCASYGVHQSESATGEQL